MPEHPQHLARPPRGEVEPPDLIALAGEDDIVLTLTGAGVGNSDGIF